MQKRLYQKLRIVFTQFTTFEIEIFAVFGPLKLFCSIYGKGQKLVPINHPVRVSHLHHQVDVKREGFIL